MVDLKLYLLCAFGGFAVYLAAFSIFYAYMRKAVGISYYQCGDNSASKYLAQGLLSAVLITAVLVLYYMVRSRSSTPMAKSMYLFVFLGTAMSARSVFGIVMEFILPAGIYEQAVVTSRNIIRYKSIKNYTFYDTGKRADQGVLYLRLFTSDSKLAGSSTLLIDRDDKAKVQKIMKQRMTSNKLYD